MFTKKMLLIIASILILVAVISIVFLNMKKKAITPIDNNSPSADSGSTSNGGVGVITPGNTTDSRGFSVKSDPAQPFALTKPRGNEPVIATNTPTKFKDYNKAVADGIIPDQNGMYHQKVDPNYDPSADPNTNYNLASSSFLNTYYPDASQYIAGQTPEQQQQMALSPIVSTSSDTAKPVSLPSNYSGPSFKKAGNSKNDFQSYFLSMDTATKSFDIVSGNPMVDVFSSSDATQLTAYKIRVSQVVDAIGKVQTPPTLLGISQEYIQTYQAALNVIDDQISLGQATTTNSLAAGATTIASDFKTYNDLLDQLSLNIKNGLALAK
jgi:hypothetical protein